MSARMCDIAVSAVSYDALLVSDLVARVQPTLFGTAYWRGDSPLPVDDADDLELLTRSARLVVVLHQRLWGRNGFTARDLIAVQTRVQTLAADATCVVMLDDSPVPPWLADAPRCTLSTEGMDGVATFIADRLAAVAGRPRVDVHAPAAVEQRRPLWGEGPQPYLAQPRAQTTLKHQLEELSGELARRLRTESDRVVDGKLDLHSTPQRTVVQVGRVGLSYSWVAGRSGVIADGRLLVIEWDGVVTHSPRMTGNTQSASPSRERVFRPQASGPDDWRWCADDGEHVSYSTRNLAGQTFDGALLALGA